MASRSVGRGKFLSPPGGTEQKQNRAWAFVSRVTVELRKEKKDDGQRSGEWFSISPNFFSPNMNP